jgi:hypothetical protein
MDLTIKVSGCEEISAALLKLPAELQDKYAQRGLEAAADLAVMAVKSRLPHATGLAQQSIGHSRVKFYRGSGTLFIAVEAQKGFKRIITATAAGKTTIHSRRTTSATADLGRVQDPRKYMHLIEKGRKAVVPTKKRAMHPALDPEGRFFAHAKQVTAHPVFQPARDAVERATVILIETELNRGVAEWNARNTASPS